MEWDGRNGLYKHMVNTHSLVEGKKGKKKKKRKRKRPSIHKMAWLSLTHSLTHTVTQRERSGNQNEAKRERERERNRCNVFAGPCSRAVADGFLTLFMKNNSLPLSFSL